MHGVREDFAGFCFAWLWVGLGVVVMVFTLLSLPITRKKKTSRIGRQLNSLPWQCVFVSLTVMETGWPVLRTCLVSIEMKARSPKKAKEEKILNERLERILMMRYRMRGDGEDEKTGKGS